MDAGPPQPRHFARVDIDEALAVSAPLLEMWDLARMFPEAPLYSGGLVDWPNVALEALAVCRAEAASIGAFLQQQAAERARGQRRA